MSENPQEATTTVIGSAGNDIAIVASIFDTGYALRAKAPWQSRKLKTIVICGVKELFLAECGDLDGDKEAVFPLP